MDVFTVVLATVLPVVPVLIFWGGVLLIDRWRITPKEKRPKLPVWAPSIVTTAMAVGMIGMTALTALLSILLVARAIISIWYRQRTTGPRSYRVTASEYLAITLITCFTATIGPWVPTEVVKIKGGAEYVGYSLSADARWMQFLDDENVLHVFSSSTVDSRTPCTQTGSSWMTDTTFRILQRNKGQEVAPSCP